MNIQNVIRYTLDNGGGTFDLEGHALVMDSGYMVGGIVPSIVVPVDDTELLGAHILSLVDDAQLYGACIGTWVHKGEVHLDLSRLVFDFDAAVESGRNTGEIAIWDIAAGVEIIL